MEPQLRAQLGGLLVSPAVYIRAYRTNLEHITNFARLDIAPAHRDRCRSWGVDRSHVLKWVIAWRSTSYRRGGR